MPFQSRFGPLTLPELPLPELIFQSPHFSAERRAIVDANTNTSFTLGQIKTKIEQVATGLAKKGLEKGQVVCIYAPNSVDFIIAWQAIALLRGIVSTVNPIYTSSEISHQLNIVKPKFVFTTSTLVKNVQQSVKEIALPLEEIFIFGSETLEGTTLFSSLTENDGNYPRRSVDIKKDIVCIPFSSGTTGLSKGVALSHFNIATNVLQMAMIDKYSTEDVFLSTLPLFHAYGMITTINLGLYLGLTSVVMTQFVLEKYLSLIQEYKPRILHVVPPIILLLSKHPLIDKYDLSSVDYIISAAAPLGLEIEQSVQKRISTLKEVKQAYGMTELSPASHYSPPGQVLPGSIGLLLPGMEAKIIDLKTGEELPINSQGELCVKGPNVMLGYYLNPQATQETIDSSGYLHTGDISTVDSNGFFFIVDRLKELIKYKGFQVAPAELESILVQHPAITDAAVIGVIDEQGEEVPKGFVVLKEGHTLTAQEVAQFVESKVSPHKKLRGGVEFVQQIPRASSGKILRRLLKPGAK